MKGHLITSQCHARRANELAEADELDQDYIGHLQAALAAAINNWEDYQKIISAFCISSYTKAWEKEREQQETSCG